MSSPTLPLTHAPAIAEAEKIVARIEDNTYWDDQQTLRALDKVAEPLARALIDFAEEART